MDSIEQIGPGRKLSRDAEDALRDLYLFCTLYVGLDLEEQPHRVMCDVLQSAEENNDRPYSMLVVPRGFYKTSIVRGMILWKFLRRLYYNDNPYHRIMIASANLALSRMTLGAVGNLMRYGGRGGRINEDFGCLWLNRTKDTPGSKVEDGINIAPRILRGEIPTAVEPSLFLGSLRRVSTGFHADECVVDDLSNRENVKTPSQLKNTLDYWHLIFPILGAKDRDGNRPKITMSCTPWHDADVRGTIIREEEAKKVENPDAVSDWNIVVRPAVNEDGSPFWPTKYPHEELARLAVNMPVREYHANYLLDPVGDSGFASEEDIRWNRRESFPPLRQGRITVDPSFHTEARDHSCFTAIIVAGFDKFAKMYVLDARGARDWTTDRFMDEMFRIAAEYPDWPIFMEDSHMGYFRLAVQMEEARRSDIEGKPVRLRVHYVPIDVKSSKYEKWEKLRPRFARGSIVFSDDIAPSIKAEIKNELVRGQAARFKDFLDALAMAETGIMPRTGRDGTYVDVTAGKTERLDEGARLLTFKDVFGRRIA
jgi:hypothetical protein